MSVNLTGKGTGLARKLYIFLSIYFFFRKSQPNATHTSTCCTQCNTCSTSTVCGVIWRESLWLLLQTQSLFLHFTTTLTHIVLSLNLQIFPALKPACYLPPFTSSLCWWLISDHTHAVLFTQTLISA